MTAKPKEFYMPPAKLTAANYKRRNSRRKMRETQIVLVDFSKDVNCSQANSNCAGIKFTNTTISKNRSNFERSKVWLSTKSIKIKIASDKWNASCLIKSKPFEGILPTHGFYYAAKKFIFDRSKAKKRIFIQKCVN